MLYEPPKTKRYILIGVVAVALVILAIEVFSLVDKNTITPISENSLLSKEILQQQKIQEQSQQLDEIRESSEMKSYSPEELNQQSKKLDELRNKIAK